MLNNEFSVDQKVLAGWHQELYRAAQKEQMASLSQAKNCTPLYTKALSSLGAKLVKMGFWLQDRSIHPSESRGLEIDESLWGSKTKASAC
jgi:hypothetical protein